MRIVVDTNVYISSLMRPESPPGVLLKRWAAGEFTLCISDCSLAEISRVLNYPRVRRYLKQTDSELKEFLGRLLLQATLFRKIPAISRTSVDPDDDHYLSLAIVAKADFLISGDKHLLELRHYGETWIVSPASMIAFLDAPSTPK